jgi:hypothetical protein
LTDPSGIENFLRRKQNKKKKKQNSAIHLHGAVGGLENELVAIVQRKDRERLVDGQPARASVLLGRSLHFGLIQPKRVVAAAQTLLDFLDGLGHNSSGPKTEHFALPIGNNLKQKKKKEKKKKIPTIPTRQKTRSKVRAKTSRA